MPARIRMAFALVLGGAKAAIAALQNGNDWPRNFAAFLGRDFDEALTYAALRKVESLGRPAGSSEWLKDLERQTGQKLLPAKRGPKKRQEGELNALSP